MNNANRIISTFYNTKTKEDQKIKIAATKIIYEDGTVDTIAKKYGLQEMLIK